ncbi:hypothetical protein [Cryptosporangium aurantiacum]|uniref:Uncharacterized protein n=1 Tax=Cryptosporangium aurantiacum TaxID=134849 RepID=A0A1M7IA28_9ACTN|nr:hypothetical protein [Cryptosporangium aurantiacum]SHM37458.1 hypothetical protein SAMN05443668_101435 [Cryptosporangium aurantiacum]
MTDENQPDPDAANPPPTPPGFPEPLWPPRFRRLLIVDGEYYELPYTTDVPGLLEELDTKLGGDTSIRVLVLDKQRRPVWLVINCRTVKTVLLDDGYGPARGEMSH